MDHKITTTQTTVGELSRRFRRNGRFMVNFILIWLDLNIDESKQHFKKSLRRLRRVEPSLQTFTNVEECFQAMKRIQRKKIFLVVSGSVGKDFVPKVHEWPQLESIYIFCVNVAVHKEWAKLMPKVKGVFNHVKPICKLLQDDREQCDQTMISVSFRGTDPLFMYTQLIKDALLQLKHDNNTSIKELVDYCRKDDDIPEQDIQLFERKYHRHSPIWWYTAPLFLYSLVNQSLRDFDIEAILKVGFFIRQLHQD